MTKRDLSFYLLLVATAAAISVLVPFVFLRVPEAQIQAGGIAQKIFYFHVPSAYGLYMSGIVCFVGSAGYLLKPTDRRNAIATAGAECAVVFGAVMLSSGPLWAKAAWGVYWQWEARLTTTLLTTLLYLATLVLRGFGGGGHAERKFAAALGVLGTVNLPVIHYAVQKWGGNHPRGVMGGGLKHPDMVTAIWLGLATLALLTPLLLWLRTAIGVAEARLARAEQRALEQGLDD
jgi:heme exporter protein C